MLMLIKTGLALCLMLIGVLGWGELRSAALRERERRSLSQSSQSGLRR